MIPVVVVVISGANTIQKGAVLRIGKTSLLRVEVCPIWEVPTVMTRTPS